MTVSDLTGCLASFAENVEKGRDAGDEPSEIRQDGGHGQLDLPERGLRAHQLETPLLEHDDLR